MSDEERDNLIKVFKHFDPNGDEDISFEEAVPMAKAFNLTREELVMVFNEIDNNGDGYLQLDEWINFIKSTSNKNYIKKKIISKIDNKEWLELLFNNNLNGDDTEDELDIDK